MKTKQFLSLAAICLVLLSCGKPSAPEYKIVWTGITPKGMYSGDEMPGNAPQYSLDSLETLMHSSLQGKTVFWLGSSITFGLIAHGEATADMFAKHNGATCYKEAASGTTIANIPQSPEAGAFLAQIIGADPSKEDLSFSARIHDLPLDVQPDLFVLQLSTNDSRLPAESIGAISSDEIIFTKGTTDSLNAQAFSFGEAFIQEGDEIIVSGVEHHPEVTIQQLMAEGDAQKILEDSYYKP